MSTAVVETMMALNSDMIESRKMGSDSMARALHNSSVDKNRWRFSTTSLIFFASIFSCSVPFSSLSRRVRGSIEL